MDKKLLDFEAIVKDIEMIASNPQCFSGAVEDICAFVRDNREAIEAGLRLLALERIATREEPIALALEGRWMSCLHLGDRCFPMRGGALDALRLKDRIDAQEEAE